jgi:hypothetical protein
MTKQELRKTVDDIKLNSGCVICGYNKHPAALSFDHTDPKSKYRTKGGHKVHIADMVKGGRYAYDTIMLEIEKCRILCLNCHMEVTHRRPDLGIEHPDDIINALRLTADFLEEFEE